MKWTVEAEIIKKLVDSDLPGFCVDIGAREIAVCNVAPLIIEHGWRGLLIEARRARTEILLRDFTGYTVKIETVWITTENVNKIVKGEIDVMNIDIDGQDYHIWKTLKARPKVICIEYNPMRDPDYIMPLDDRYDWKHDEDRTRYGAGRKSMLSLADEKGYKLKEETDHNLIFLEK